MININDIKNINNSLKISVNYLYGSIIIVIECYKSISVEEYQHGGNKSMRLQSKIYKSRGDAAAAFISCLFLPKVSYESCLDTHKAEGESR